MATAHPTIIRRRDVEARTGLSRSAIYSRLRPNPRRPNDYDPTFPRPISIGARAVGWIASEVDAWIAARTADRDGRKPEPSRRATTLRRLSLPTAVPILNGESGG